jgi:hypothetical protein
MPDGVVAVAVIMDWKEFETLNTQKRPDMLKWFITDCLSPSRFPKNHLYFILPETKNYAIISDFTVCCLFLFKDFKINEWKICGYYLPFYQPLALLPAMH